MRLNITPRAKREARKGLRQRKMFNDPPGLTPKEAKRAGVKSGVSRARQLIREDSLSLKEAKSVAGFYNRFKNCRTPRCETALDLWGGRTFGRKASQFVKRQKKK